MAFQGLRRLWLESAAPCLNRTFVTGVSLPVAWIGRVGSKLWPSLWPPEFGDPASGLRAECEPEHFDGPRERRPLDQFVVVGEKCADSCSASTT